MRKILYAGMLIMICNISYADIASTGYVDSAVATKQDTITDIATIRSGSAAGATAVQPSSLSTVATSGSYNDLSNKPTIPTVPTNISSFTNDSGYITTSYHDSTKQDKLPNIPGNNGKYKLVYNSNTGQLGWEFEQFSLTCSSGTYDIGFDQCVDVNISIQLDSDMGIYSHDGSNTTNASYYGLTVPGSWAVKFSYGTIKGIASCDSTEVVDGVDLFNNFEPFVSNRTFSQSSTGRFCWCKMTQPASSKWVFHNAFYGGGAEECNYYCANYCTDVALQKSLRSLIYGSVGQ